MLLPARQTLPSRGKFNDNRTVASTPLTSAALPQPSIAEKFFQWSLYLLLVTGFTALAGTGKLDFPSLAVVVPALALRGYHLWRGRTVIIPERMTSYLTIAYFGFYAADYFFISQTFIGATVHMVLFIMVVKVFSVQRDRDLFYLAVIAFLMVLATVVLTVGTMFLFTFFLFMLVAMATFISLEMRRSERQAQAAAALPEKGSGFQRSLSAIVVVLGVSTLVGAALIFLVLPRINSGGYLRSLGAQGEVVTGFSQSVNLGGIGEIQQSNTVVMHVQIMQGQLPADTKWRGVALANFDGRRWWNEPAAPALASLRLCPWTSPNSGPTACRCTLLFRRHTPT
jgi:protein-glutamine gamma-glutamyltransferase